MPNCITCCFIVIYEIYPILLSVKKLYTFVKPYSFFNESTGLLLDMRRLFIMMQNETSAIMTMSARIKYHGDNAIFSEKFLSHAEAAKYAPTFPRMIAGMLSFMISAT